MVKRSAFLFAILLAASPAFADAPPTVAPVSMGPPHVCAQRYPARAIAVHAEGMTVLVFVVASDGSVKNVKVSRSSGNDDLDAAAVACAETWRYHPATRDGTAVETPWQASVAWKMGRADILPPPRDCAKFIPAGVTAASGVTKVSFGLNDDGSTRMQRVAESSGNDALDQAALGCITAMKLHLTTKAPPSFFRITSDIDWAKELAPSK
jgi:TonB family protein